MRNEDLSRLPTYNKNSGVIEQFLAQKKWYSRKEFLEEIEKKKSTLNRIKETRDASKSQINILKENIVKFANDIKNLTRFIEEDNRLAKSFLDDYRSDCKKDIDMKLTKVKFFTLLSKFDKSWDKDSRDWKDFEWERTKVLQEVHQDKDLILKYPDFMIKDIVWGKDYDPMKSR